jgi:hypothetical protein
MGAAASAASPAALASTAPSSARRRRRHRAEDDADERHAAAGIEPQTHRDARERDRHRVLGPGAVDQLVEGAPLAGDGDGDPERGQHAAGRQAEAAGADDHLADRPDRDAVGRERLDLRVERPQGRHAVAGGRGVGDVAAQGRRVPDRGRCEALGHLAQ